MTGFLALVNHLFDILVWPFRSLHPFYSLTVFSLLTTVFTLIVFRYASDQPAMRRVKDRLQAHVLEVRLFPDQLPVVLRAYLRLLAGVLIYLRHSLKPLALLILPLLLILVQLEAHFGRIPIRVGDNFLLKARLSEIAALDQVSLRLPQGLRSTAPALHIPDMREIDWRIQAELPGQHRAEIMVGDRAFSKQILVATPLTRPSPQRVRGSLWEQFLHPGEAPLPEDGPLERIEVQYQPRKFHFGSFAIEWLAPFLVMTLIGAFALKGIFRTEI
ncbi:MAG: hypothetical protein AUG07_07080 [Acidobacteria bacterium 13_1_20CM_2_60_10]|nr:MAG: hypothetical protein AUG07_07080 [Acidobacteria bacterium 13_1_20CM_2_60_10]